MDCSPPDSLSIGFPKQEYCSGLPFPSPGDLPDPGIEPASSGLAGRFFLCSSLWWGLHEPILVSKFIELYTKIGGKSILLHNLKNKINAHMYICICVWWFSC